MPPAPVYYDDEPDLTTHRLGLVVVSTLLHGLLLAAAIFLTHFTGISLWDQVFHNNPEMRVLIVLTAASCIISLILSYALTYATIKPITLWLLGVLTPPVLFGLLALMVMRR